MRAVDAARRTNMRWHEHPVTQTFLVFTVMVGVFAVQNVYVTQLFPQSVKKQAVALSQDLTNVAAVGGCPSPVIDGVESGHPTFDPSVAESDPFNNFAPAISGLSRASDSKQKFDNIIPTDKIDASRIKLGTVLEDSKIELVEAMTPVSPYANQNPDRPSDGTVIKVKTKPGQVIRAPDSGRKISGSGDRYIGMVMYATADGVRFANSRNDKPTGTEGYNLYIWGINTEASVVSNYGRGQNEFKRKCFPQFKAGDKLGTAKGDYIYMALRDNGDFVSIRDVSWWDGKVTSGQAATGDTSSPTAAAPTAAPGGTTVAPTAASGAARVLSVEQTATAFSATIEGDKTKITIKGSFYVIGPVNRNDWTNANLDIHKVLGMAFSEKSAGAKVYVKETGNEQVDLSAQLSLSTFTFYTKKISGLKSINLKIDFPYSATHGNAVTVNFKINSPSSADMPTPTARVSTAPTATPTRTAGTPNPTSGAGGAATPTALPTMGRLREIVMTRDEALSLRDSQIENSAFPGTFEVQVGKIFANCGLNGYRYIVRHVDSEGSVDTSETLITDATCIKQGTNKIIIKFNNPMLIRRSDTAIILKNNDTGKFIGAIIL